MADRRIEREIILDSIVDWKLDHPDEDMHFLMTALFMELYDVPLSKLDDYLIICQEHLASFRQHCRQIMAGI